MKDYIRCQQLAKEFAGKTIFQEVTFTVAKGEIISLLGPSGVGKSTLLRCLAGLEVLTKGQIYIDQQDVTSQRAEDRPAVMLFQQPLLFPHLTVIENITYGLRAQRVGKKDLQLQGQKVLKKIELPDYARMYPYQLSGGEQQRVALARALLTRPKLLLLDEPFSSLDSELRHHIRDWVFQLLKEEGTTAIFVTHDQAEAMMVGDRLAVMKNQTIQQIGSQADIYHHPKNREVAEFFFRGLILDQRSYIPVEKLQLAPFSSPELNINKLKWTGYIKSRFINQGQVFDRINLENFDQDIYLIANQKLSVQEKVLILADPSDLAYFSEV